MSITCLKSSLLENAGFPVHGFTTRSGGVSDGPFQSLNLGFDVGDSDEHVRENLARLNRVVAPDLPLARAKQIHGIAVVDAEQARLSTWASRPAVEADAVVATDRSVVAVQTADCAPVLIACPKTRIVAAVHAGWRGTAKGVIRKCIRHMTDLGSAPRDLIAAIGPTIGYPCYEVGDEVAKVLPESADPIPKTPGKHRLDLVNAVEVSLIVEGISTDRMQRVGGCPHCDEETYFSYRKSGGKTGRIFGFISGFSL
jgi:polyphenol oxidase